MRRNRWDHTTPKQNSTTRNDATGSHERTAVSMTKRHSNITMTRHSLSARYTLTAMHACVTEARMCYRSTIYRPTAVRKSNKNFTIDRPKIYGSFLYWFAMSYDHYIYWKKEYKKSRRKKYFPTPKLNSTTPNDGTGNHEHTTVSMTKRHDGSITTRHSVVSRLGIHARPCTLVLQQHAAALTYRKCTAVQISNKNCTIDRPKK